MAHGICIDAKNKQIREDDVNGLEDYYREIQCELIDIVSVNINGYDYDLIVDDEGLFDEAPIVSALGDGFRPMLVGNIIVLRHDGEGNEVSLEDFDMANIISRIAYGNDNFVLILARHIEEDEPPLN